MIPLWARAIATQRRGLILEGLELMKDFPAGARFDLP